MTIAANGPGDVTLGADDRAAAVADVKTLLRIVTDGEDALIARFIETALALAERFTGRVAIARTMTETVPATPAWQALGAMPVASIASVADADGTPLATDAYRIDIDADARGWVRVLDAGDDALAHVTLRAGSAADWASLPAPIRQGVILLAGHLFTERNASTPPPAAVTALWRPFRVMRLNAATRL
ncbi:phage head-tail connector protein [Hephaestia sp. GCM10023244]|uniref:head-tail connector protein n=1 Tax=unclassified Hephaestia TaxID=2631281 RepID=UPI002076D5CA|nr:phage head-tail connector protein [Hephaestia sp. MAHUQ-44]MCM8729700.1 phage head-tail connector protein [Hephaestia sp. MAHUQ-44]